MLGKNLGNSQASNGNAGVEEAVPEGPTEAPLNDPVLNRDDGVEAERERGQIRADGNQPPGIDHGNGYAIVDKSTCSGDRVGHARPRADDEHAGTAGRHLLVEEHVDVAHSPQRGHRFGQSPLPVAQDSGCIVHADCLAQLLAQGVLVSGGGQAQAGDQRTHGDVPHAVVGCPVGSGDSRAIEDKGDAGAMERNVHEELIEPSVQERGVERNNGVRPLIGHAGGRRHRFGLGNADVYHATGECLVHGSKPHRLHHRGRDAHDVLARGGQGANLVGKDAREAKAFGSDGQSGLGVDGADRVEAVRDVLLGGRVAASLLGDHVHEDGLVEGTRAPQRGLDRRDVVAIDGAHVLQAEVLEHNLGVESVLDSRLQAVESVVGGAPRNALAEKMLLPPREGTLVARGRAQGIQVSGQASDRGGVGATVVVDNDRDAPVLRGRDVVEGLPGHSAGQRAVSDDGDRPRAIPAPMLLPRDPIDPRQRR